MTPQIRWQPTLVILGGIVTTIGAGLTLGFQYLCLGALATITYAAFAPSVIDSTRVPEGAAADPREVKKWREEHPGAIVSEAIAAVSER
ncbi:hypothetical protein [Curtobacterium luteum]|uniref:Uncharacterized protein n=1 Tax=Curtobacterium luteum TaxID=33881 RepID=A0A175RKD1_9MICO|nr:hypothetical protein [Curtobacterium luteum]KTR03229.1 hypothetical protein NS184_14205 [Curtobacterium luteum]